MSTANHVVDSTCSPSYQEPNKTEAHKMKTSGCLANTVLILALPILLGIVWLLFGTRIMDTIESGRQHQAEIRAEAQKRQEMEEAAKAIASLPSIETWTFAEVVSRHGEPQQKDQGSGWALWPSFKARFENGVVVEVAVSQSKNH